MRKDCDYLIQLAKHKPTLFFDKYSWRLEIFRHLPVHISTIHQTLRQAGLSIKHVQKLASERDPLKRADFCLISIDEVSKDDRTYARLWGRSKEGDRAEEHNLFVRKRRFTMCTGMALDEGIVSSRVLEGSFTHERFMEFLCDDVVRSPSPLGVRILTHIPLETP
ncbi:hypothetical protein DFP72DRAFT_831644 [Ephemerocybe angulata]|uniref:Transposase n=1 Tax=Ephemerocybe angulata TaxID=980116 RepID=A0A8H6LTG0_9AGAR|nr:hypothetical protein DFP72DRAFT_831644 [Tulosesus angulatus]